MPRLRPPKQQVNEIQKPFDSSMLTPKEEEPLHDNEEVIEAAQEEKPVKKAEPEVVKTEEKQEDPALALQKQLEELKKSEEIQRNLAGHAAKERDEAVKRAQQRDVEVTRFQKEATQANYDNISTALAAAQESAEAAKRDMKTAISNADPDLQADAMERWATARANISKLEDGKYELEARVRAEKAAPKVEPQQEQPKQPTVEQNIDSWNLPDITTKYLKAHQDYLRDPVRFNELRYWNDRAAKAGLTVHTQAYLDYVEEKMNPPAEEKPEKQEQQRTNIVSAPVSREVPSGGTGKRDGGKITLTKDEQDAARISGITETEYARQKQKLIEAKANGQYTGGQ